MSEPKAPLEIVPCEPIFATTCTARVSPRGHLSLLFGFEDAGDTRGETNRLAACVVIPDGDIERVLAGITAGLAKSGERN